MWQYYLLIENLKQLYKAVDTFSLAEFSLVSPQHNNSSLKLASLFVVPKHYPGESSLSREGSVDNRIINLISLLADKANGQHLAKQQENPQVVTLLATPEYFFHKDRRLYSIEHFIALATRMQEVITPTVHPNVHLLISSLLVKTSLGDLKEGQTTVIFNIAIYLWRGNINLIVKQHPSRIDRKIRGALLYNIDKPICRLAMTKLHRIIYDNRPSWLLSPVVEVVTLHGKKMVLAVDICRDNMFRVAEHDLRKLYSSRIELLATPFVHIVTSDQMYPRDRFSHLTINVDSQKPRTFFNSERSDIITTGSNQISSPPFGAPFSIEPQPPYPLLSALVAIWQKFFLIFKVNFFEFCPAAALFGFVKLSYSGRSLLFNNTTPSDHTRLIPSDLWDSTCPYKLDKNHRGQ